MRRGLICATLFLLLAVQFSAPLFETIDRWDGFPQSGNDLELGVIAALASFGVVLLTPVLLRCTTSPTGRRPQAPVRTHASTVAAHELSEPPHLNFPPLALRV